MHYHIEAWPRHDSSPDICFCSIILFNSAWDFALFVFYFCKGQLAARYNVWVLPFSLSCFLILYYFFSFSQIFQRVMAMVENWKIACLSRKRDLLDFIWRWSLSLFQECQRHFTGWLKLANWTFMDGTPLKCHCYKNMKTSNCGLCYSMDIWIDEA